MWGSRFGACRVPLRALFQRIYRIFYMSFEIRGLGSKGIWLWGLGVQGLRVCGFS